MSRWIAAILALVVLAGAYHTFTQYNALIEARAVLKATQDRANAQLRVNDMIRAYAAQQAAKADSAEAVVAVTVKRAQRAEGKLAAATTVRDSLDASLEATDAYRSALETQMTASAALRLRGDSLQAANADLAQIVRDYGDASQGVLDATKPSFLSRFVPKVGIGAAAGYDPVNNQLGAVIGPTLTWSF